MTDMRGFEPKNFEYGTNINSLSTGTDLNCVQKYTFDLTEDILNREGFINSVYGSNRFDC